MKRISPLVAFALLSLVTITPPAHAQGAPTKAAEAARQQKLKAQQAAALQAAAAAKANTPPTPTTAPTPVATINRPIPTAVVIPTATPATSSSAKPATSGSAKPTGSAAPAGSGVPVPLSTHTETAAIALDLDALKKSRPDRRHAEFTDLQARWGGLLADPRAAAELKQHSSRIAYLQRIRALGSKANDTTFVKGVDALITKEETRDANAMNALRSGALPVAPPPAAAAPTPAPGASK